MEWIVLLLTGIAFVMLRREGVKFLMFGMEVDMTGGGKDEPKHIDIENLGEVSEENLEAAITTGTGVVDPSKAGGGADEEAAKAEKSKSDKPEGGEETTEPGAAAGASKEEKPAGEKPGEVKDDTTKGEKLLAGKFKTEPELKTNILEAAKALKYNEKIVEKAIAGAKNTAELEEMYKEMDAAISANVKAAGGPEKAEPGKPGAQAAEDQKKAQDEAAAYLLTETLKTIRRSDTVKLLAKNGINLPEKFMIDREVTQEFMGKLYDIEPADYYELKRLTESTYHGVKQNVEKYVNTLHEAETQNEATYLAEEKAIMDYAKGIGLPWTEQQQKAFLEAAVKLPTIYEEKNGVNFLRKDGLFQVWYWQNRETIEKQREIKAKVDARKQYDADIADMTKRSADGITGAHVASAKKKDGTFDPEDPTQTGLLSDEELEERIAKGVTKAK